MKKINCLAVCLFCCCFFVKAQQDTAIANAEIRKLTETAEKQFVSKYYTAALENINKAIAVNGKPDGQLLYFKIRVLEAVYNKSNDLTTELETTLQNFFKQTNQFTFSENKYADAARINNALQQFKQSDKAFADSVKYKADLKNMQATAALQQRITGYLNDNPNTYYKTYLSAVTAEIQAVQQREEAVRLKLATDSTNRLALKKAGKRTGINISYAIPNSTIKGVHNSFTSGNALENFFGDTGTIALGAKYAVGLSLFDIVIPVFTSPHVRFSIDWNLFDGEYYQFDWTKDTITNAGTFNAVKAGTRIGPSLSFLVTKKINAAVYYSARPGVQFVINKLEYNAGQGGSEQGGYYLKPALNYNLSNEVGAKIRFGKFMINPFYHFGKFTWKSEITTNNSDTKKLNEIETGYKFSYLGIRIGI